MDKLYIVIPAYNEEANIETVIREWYPIIEERSEDSRLVIIDDGSKDSTYKIMQTLATIPQILNIRSCSIRFPPFCRKVTNNCSLFTFHFSLYFVLVQKK